MSADLLMEMAWKSLLLGGAALLLNAMLGRRPAVERVALLRTATVLLLALPPLAMVLPTIPVTTWSPVPAGAPSLASLPHSETPALFAPAAASAPPVARFDMALLIAGLYALGASLLLLRLVVGVLLLRRWTSDGRPVDDPLWHTALVKLTALPIRLAVSPHVRAPLSWGVRPATILLSPEALTHPEQADAVLAHEIAHVRRHDWTFLMLSQIATALFWFNPVAWLLKRELAHQSEEAADAFALNHVEPSHYAGALLAFVRPGAPHHAATGMAIVRGTLARRVASILGERPPRASGNRVLAIAVTGGCLGLATPLAALELVAARPDTQPSDDAVPAVPVVTLASTTASQALVIGDTAVTYMPGAAAVAASGDGEALAMQWPAAPQPQVQPAQQTGSPRARPVPTAAPMPIVQPAVIASSAPMPAPVPAPVVSPDPADEMHAGVSEMRNGAVEMERGAVEMERTAATAPLSEREREKLLGEAERLREGAAELRERAEAMRARADELRERARASR